jgi:hypothetical protein
MKQLLTRIFHTNPFTTIGGLLAGMAVVLLLLHQLNATEFLALIGSAVTVIGLASKDGVRADVPVAPENVDSAAPRPLTGAAVVLLLFWLALFTGCSSVFFKAGASPTALDAVGKSMLASQLSHHFGSARPVRVPLTDADLDSLATKQAFPEAPYLAAPPAGLNKRELRKWHRAQRQAMREASRTVPAKIKLTGGSAYAAPDGTAVALNKANAPVAAGAGAVASDYTKQGQNANGPAAVGRDFAGPLSGASTPPKRNLLQRIEDWFITYWPVLLGLGVFAFLGYLRLGPVGTGLRAASTLARNKPINYPGRL